MRPDLNEKRELVVAFFSNASALRYRADRSEKREDRVGPFETAANFLDDLLLQGHVTSGGGHIVVTYPDGRCFRYVIERSTSRTIGKPIYTDLNIKK